ncbi:MAG: hypothetical protein H7Y38_16720 [Armatimonadetes bacterium]|nr:hypothetical protein [Armatimonadota bacterium]
MLTQTFVKEPLSRSPIFPVRLSRRALLSAGTAWSVATLLAGCGGSSSEEDDVRPETYAEAYRLRLRDTEGVYDDAQIVGVTSGGDLLLTTRRLVYDSDALQATASAFRLSRYTNRAQPDLTRREDFLPTRMLPVGGSFGLTALSANGNLYVSRHLAEPLAGGSGGDEVLIFAPDATQTGSVTPKTIEGLVSIGGAFPYYTHSVSPSGDFYAPISTQLSTYGEQEINITRWNRDGAIVARYKSASRFRFTGNRVSFLPDGTAVTTGYDSQAEQYGIVRADGQPGLDVPLQRETERIEHLQTDAFGNFYCYMFNDETSRATRLTPPFPTPYICKFSPNGTLLTQISPNRGTGTPFAVDGDGTIYMIGVDSLLMVYKQTR